MAPSWWVPIRWPALPLLTGSSPSPAPSGGSGPTTKQPPSFAFLPTFFSNRPTGPLVGPGGELISSGPGGTAQTLGQAKQATGYAGQAIQLAQALTVQIVNGVGTIIGAVTGALGLAQGLTMDSKTGVSETIKQDTINSAAFSLATTAATAAAAAVSVATGVLTAGLLLPIAAFFTASSINDASSAIARAKGELRDYTAAQTMLKLVAARVASCSDRLDELHMLPRVSNRAMAAKWCADNYLLAAWAILQRNQLLWAMDHIRNGEHMAGVPNRDISGLTAMIGQAYDDAIVLYLATRDILARMKAPIPNSFVSVRMAGRAMADQSFSPTLDIAGLIPELASAGGFDSVPGLVPGMSVQSHSTDESDNIVRPENQVVPAAGSVQQAQAVRSFAYQQAVQGGIDPAAAEALAAQVEADAFAAAQASAMNVSAP